jgi:heme exporter protein D
MGGLSEFLAMGGYGVFIWPAYIIAVVILLALLIQSLVVLRQRERLLESLRLEVRGHDGPDEENET